MSLRRPASTRMACYGGASRLSEAAGGRLGEAFLLVDPFVVADLAEQVGQRIETRVVVGERRLERLGIPARMLSHELHVLMLGVVFEVGVEPVAPRRADHVKEPG